MNLEALIWKTANAKHLADSADGRAVDNIVLALTDPICGYGTIVKQIKAHIDYWEKFPTYTNRPDFII